jgi:hypothetical protein
MRTNKIKIKKQIQFKNGLLYLKMPSDLGKDTYEIIELGTVLTKKGSLTRQDKIRAVAANGDWIDI